MPFKQWAADNDWTHGKMTDLSRWNTVNIHNWLIERWGWIEEIVGWLINVKLSYQVVWGGFGCFTGQTAMLAALLQWNTCVWQTGTDSDRSADVLRLLLWKIFITSAERNRWHRRPKQHSNSHGTSCWLTVSNSLCLELFNQHSPLSLALFVLTLFYRVKR